MKFKKSYIISSYFGFLNYINETCYYVLKNSFLDLGFDLILINYFEHSIGSFEIKKIRDSVVVLMMVPEFAKNIVQYIDRSNKIILWNLERTLPLDYKKIKNKKTDRSIMRTEILEELLKSSSIDWLFLHDNIYFLIFEKYKNVSFVPIGFHECLIPNDIVKSKKNEICLFGFNTEYRELFISEITRNKRDIYFIFYNGNNFSNAISRINEIKKFYISIDYPSTAIFKNSVSIQRIVTLASSGILIFSYADMERFGFVEGTDYIGFNGACDFVKKFDDLTFEKISNISSNMIKKIKDNFHMTQLLFYEFTKMGIL